MPKTGIQFMENKGQWPNNVLFKADIPIGNLFIEKNTLTYLFADKEAAHERAHGKNISSVHFHSVKVNFIGANPNPQIIKDQKSPEYYNFFVGDQSKWATNVFAYKKIILKEIYKKIDLEILSNGEGIKINFLLQPGGNPNDIELDYQGADNLFIKNKMLHVTSSLGELLEEAPISFQDYGGNRLLVKTQFTLNQNRVKFKLGDFHQDLPLTIDPAVVFGTYVGSAADNFGFAASYDVNGNAYGAGTVYAANFPYTTGAFDISFNGGNSDGEYARDAFVVKFNPGGSSLLFGTFIGGAHNEQPHSVTVSNNEVIIFGTTYSADFPVTNSSFDKTYNGGADIFVLKLNGAGNTLLASTYIGGSQDDGINGDPQGSYQGQSHNLPYNYADWFRGEVIVDMAANIYVSTTTKSSQSQGLPLINASQSAFGGGTQDGFVVKLNNVLTNILFSTYIGGSGDESAYSICVNNLNEPIIGGGTTSGSLQFNSTAFPFKGGVDGFIARFSSNGSKQRIIYTGSTGYDQVFFVQTDNNNNIYTLGQTNGIMPRSSGTYGTSNAKQFLEKYNPDLSSKLLSTTFGKANAEPSLSPAAFLVDVCGRVYVSGWGGGANLGYHNGLDNVFQMPTTADAFQKTTDGSDFYLMVLSPDFGQLLYASFYGGIQSQEHVDGGTSHFDKSGIVYQAVCAGCGGLNDFPTTVDAYSRINPGKRAYNTNVGGCNLGLFKFDMRTYIIPPQFKDTLLVVYAGQNLSYNFSATDPGGDNLTMTFSGNILTRLNNPAAITIDGSSPGLITATLNWNTLCSDFISPFDTLVIDVTVKDGACPVPNEITGKIKILLRSDPIPPPFPECVRIIDDQTLKVTWINPTANADFLNYQIYRSTNKGKMQAYDSVFSMLTTLYNDPNAAHNLDTNYCYQMLSLNRCRVAGDSSRVICSLFKEDTSTAVFFTGIDAELFVLHAYDTFSRSFYISDTDPKDSVFVKTSGNFITLKKGSVVTGDGQGGAFVNVSWMPDCNDIGKDTLELLLNIRDNTCPQFKQALKPVRFVIIPPEPALAPTIFCPKKINQDSVMVEWPTFQKKPLTTHLYLIRRVNGVVQKIVDFSDLNTRNYIDLISLDPAKDICYAITSSDFCSFFGDTSTYTCAQHNQNPAPNLTIYTATVSNNSEIKLYWQQAEADSFWRYEVRKKVGRNGGVFETIAEVRSLGDTVFTDTDVKVDKQSYCYQLINTDVCGNKSIQNREACTILLTGRSEPFVNKMDWLPYEYWLSGINRYELLKTEPGIYFENLFVTTGEKPLVAVDNKLNYDNGLYQYRVVAYESNFGYKQESSSNTIELIQLPLLYAPNAYTENGDGLNDLFHTIPVFVKDYHLQIYNRWGDRIFETYNKKEGFAGNYKGKETQEDVYFYLVEYTGWDESKYIKKGNFTILR